MLKQVISFTGRQVVVHINAQPKKDRTVSLIFIRIEADTERNGQRYEENVENFVMKMSINYLHVS